MTSFSYFVSELIKNKNVFAAFCKTNAFLSNNWFDITLIPLLSKIFYTRVIYSKFISEEL